MQTIDLSFKTNKKVTRTLPKRGLKHYRQILPITEANVIETYSFILPTMAGKKDKGFLGYFILQVKEGCIDITDGTYIIHYGINKDIKDFKLFLHCLFYGKIVSVVIFEYKGRKEYGLLYEDFIYYQPYTICDSNVFFQTNEILVRNDFNRYYKLNEIKIQDIYVDAYDYAKTKLEVDLNKMYYATTLWDGEDRQRYVRINEYNIDFLREFYVNEFKSVAIAEIKNTNNTDIAIK